MAYTYLLGDFSSYLAYYSKTEHIRPPAHGPGFYSHPRSSTMLLSLFQLRRLALVMMLVLAEMAAGQLAGAEKTSNRTFDIPAGVSDASIKLFVAQSGGVEVIFATDEAVGVKTNSVKGSYTVAEALDRLLAGTVLSAEQDQQSGAFIVKRSGARSTSSDAKNLEAAENPKKKRTSKMTKNHPIRHWLAALLLAGAADASAQSSDPGASEPAAVASSTGADQKAAEKAEKTDDIVKMSKFVVRTTQGMGYVDANSASGFKTNQAMLNIPQSGLVLTNDLINDIQKGIAFGDITRYAGSPPSFRVPYGNNTMVRGARISDVIIDGFGRSAQASFVDTSYIDTIEILRGSTAVLYAGTGVTGNVIVTTKKPLKIRQDLISVSMDSSGLLRSTLDVTGPIGSIGDAKFSYRLVGGYQKNGEYFENNELTIQAIHPSVEMDFHNTTLILQAGFENYTGNTVAAGVLTPTGDVYNGGAAGYKYAQGTFRGINQAESATRQFRASLIQKFTDDWEMHLYAMKNAGSRLGPAQVGLGVNYQNNTMSGIFNGSDGKSDVWELQCDVIGKYQLGKIPCETTFGFSHIDELELGLHRKPKDPNYGTYSIPLGNAAAFSSINILQPATDYYVDPTNPGSRQQLYFEQLFVQEQVDIIPNRLSLVAAGSFIKTETINVSNTLQKTPYTSTDTSFQASVGRAGAVFHVTKDLSLYVLDSRNATINQGKDINGNRLPNIEEQDREVGLKMALNEGRIVGSMAVFELKRTNQSVPSATPDQFGFFYSVPTGQTVIRGWDASLALAPYPGLQIIATGYVGTLKDQNNKQVTSENYGNMVTAFVHYDFPKESSLGKFSLGGGISRVGARWVSTDRIVFPVGMTQPALFKMKEGTMAQAFVTYQFNNHCSAKLLCDNLFDERYPLGYELTTIIEPSRPRSYGISINYKL